MTFQNVDHLEAVVDVAEEDDVASVRKAADVGSELRPCSPERAGEAGQVLEPEDAVTEALAATAAPVSATTRQTP